jgi:hypothetical protein
MGSNPVPVTIDGRLAQLGERLPYKQDVSSSILLSPTIFLKRTLLKLGVFFFLVGQGGPAIGDGEKWLVYQPLFSVPDGWSPNGLLLLLAYKCHYKI